MSDKGLDIKLGLNYINIIKNTKNELSLKSSAHSYFPLDSEGDRVIDDFSEDESNDEADESQDPNSDTLKTYISSDIDLVSSESSQIESLLTIIEEASISRTLKTFDGISEDDHGTGRSHYNTKEISALK